MASSSVDLERGDPGSPSGHELAPLRTANSRGSQSPDPASGGRPPATQVSGQNLASSSSSAGPVPNNVQDPGGDAARSVPSARPSGAPVPGSSGSQGQQVSPAEPDSDHFAQFCTIYNEKAKKYDEVLTERLRGSADSLLIFAGLFAATVTAFIIESYKTLSPDSGDTALVYLAFIAQQLAAASQSTGQANATIQLPLPAPQPFVLTRSSVKVNILWILSLIFSIVSALAATLVQSWLTRYKRLVNQSPQPEQRASERSYYFRGVVQFRLVILAEALPALLHISLFLFLAGLIVFLFPINGEVAHVITSVIVAFATLYLGLTIIPILAAHALYRTPFTAIFNPLLNVVLRCWIAVIASCRTFAENHRPLNVLEGLWWWLGGFEGTCREAYRRRIWHKQPARTFDDKRTAEARDWLISQLTTDQEHEALMNILISLFTCPSKVNSEWLRLFQSDQPPMPLHYLVPHLPSILGSCLTPVQATTSRPSPDDCDRHRHIQSCQAVILKMIQALKIELDTSFSALVSLRRLRNDQDAFIASHANTTTTLILLDALRNVSNRNQPSLRIPRKWRFTDILLWVDSCSSDVFVSRCPIIIDVLAVSLLPLSSASVSDNKHHNRTTVYLGRNDTLTIGECAQEEDTIIISPQDYRTVFSLIALNELIGQLLDSDGLSNLAPPDPESPLDIQLFARIVENIISSVWAISVKSSLPSLSHDVEHTLIHHTETIVNELESASSNGQSVDVRSGQPGLPPLSSLLTVQAVRYLMLIVGCCLSDPDARSKGSALSNIFLEKCSVWFP